MPDQKGSLLDRIKAFFIRRRNNKIKKELQQRKDLEKILKNITDKVEPMGTVINVRGAIDKVNLNKISLNTNKDSVRVVNDIVGKKNKDSVSKEEIVEFDSVKAKSTKDKIIIDEVLEDADIDYLKQLRTKVIDNENVKKQDVIVDVSIPLAPVVEEKTDKVIEVQTEHKVLEDNRIDENDVSHVIDNKVSVQQDNKTFKKSGLFVKDVKKNDVSIKKNNKVKFKDKNKLNLKSKLKSNKYIEEEVSLALIRMIDRNLYELAYFKEELAFLRAKNNSAKTEEEIFEVEQRFLILKERLEKVYEEFLQYKNNDLVINANYDSELIELVNKYKLDIYENENIEQILKNMESDFKESLNVIESIVCLEKETEILGDEIYSNHEDIRIKDENLNKDSETIQKIEYMKKEIDSDLTRNNQIINDVVSKVGSIHPEQRVQYQFNVVNNLINSAFRFGFSFAMLNPNNGRLANAIGAVSMVNSIRSLSRVFEPEKRVYYVTSGDFENEILEHLNDFSYINKNINLSIEEIDKLKNEFNNKFSDYKELPEVIEAYQNINKLSNQLKDIKVIMNSQENKLNKALELNNQMVKKIES